MRLSRRRRRPGVGSGLRSPCAARLPASCPSLARCFLRFVILTSRRKQRRLPGTGSSSLSRSPVAQVFNLCVFHGSHAISKGRAAGSGARAEDGDMCGHWAALFRWGRELAHAAGFEHVTGRLRCCNDTRRSRVPLRALARRIPGRQPAPLSPPTHRHPSTVAGCPPGR